MKWELIVIAHNHYLFCCYRWSLKSLEWAIGAIIIGKKVIYLIYNVTTLSDSDLMFPLWLANCGGCSSDDLISCFNKLFWCLTSWIAMHLNYFTTKQAFSLSFSDLIVMGTHCSLATLIEAAKTIIIQVPGVLSQ